MVFEKKIQKFLAMFMVAILIMTVFSSFLPMKGVLAASKKSGNCGTNVSWELNDSGELRIYGTGSMKGYFMDNAPWYNFREEIKTVIVEEGITGIGEEAFHSCNNLSSVVFPTSLQNIYTNAFYHCTSLVTINIPEGVQNIESAFWSCTSLKSVTLPQSLKKNEGSI